MTNEDELRKAAEEATPVAMVLFCPACGAQHIDAPDTEVGQRGDRWETAWNNPPHRSHLCHGCGHIWRPADVPTNGVAAILTRGKADSEIASPPSEIEGLRRELDGLWRFLHAQWVAMGRLTNEGTQAAETLAWRERVYAINTHFQSLLSTEVHRREEVERALRQIMGISSPTIRIERPRHNLDAVWEIAHQALDTSLRGGRHDEL